MTFWKNLFTTTESRSEKVLRISDSILTINDYTPAFGTADFVQLAHTAVKNGFTVSFFGITDHYLAPLEESDSENISDEMIHMLNEYGVEELHAALRDEFDNYYISDMEICDSATRQSFALDRRGVVRAPDEGRLLTLIQAMYTDMGYIVTVRD